MGSPYVSDDEYHTILIILQDDETFASASNLIVPINTMHALFQRERKLYQFYECRCQNIIEEIMLTIHINLKDKQYVIIDQQLFDAIAKLYPLAFFAGNKIMMSIFCEILLSSRNLLYDNVLQIYADSLSKYHYHVVTIARDPSRMIVKLVEHKTLPLSEQDTLNIIKYPDIAMIILNEIKECFTYTYNVLYDMIEKSRHVVYWKYKQIIRSRR